MNSNYIQQIALYLENGCHSDPNVRQQAIDFINQAQQNLPDYGPILLQILGSNSFPDNTRQIAAISLKNYVIKYYKFSDDSRNKVSTENKTFLKSKIIDLLISSSEVIKKQLMEIVNAICLFDYPDNWPNLIKHIVSILGNVSVHNVKDLLTVTDLIFKRYCYESRSDELWAEIKFSLTEFANPLTSIFTQYSQQLPTLTENNPNTTPIYSILILCTKMFYSLNFQEIPEFFENNMTSWMNIFNSILSLPLMSSHPNVNPHLCKLQRHVCNSLELYVVKYSDEFSSYSDFFSQSMCNLLFPLPSEQQYDSLASSALAYLCAVSKDSQFLSRPGIMESVCGEILIRSIQLNDVDCRLFFEDPFEYIERDLEDSNVKTRRKTAMELLTNLCMLDAPRVVNIFSDYIDKLIKNYNENRAQNWKMMNVAIVLVSALSSRSEGGKFDPKNFFMLTLKNELETNESDLTMRPFAFIKCDVVRYIIRFKTLFSNEEKFAIMEKVVVFLRSPIVGLHTYASILIESFLSVKFKESFRQFENNIVRFLDVCYPSIFNILASTSLDDNIYVIKSLFKVAQVTRLHTPRYLGIVRGYFKDKLPAIISSGTNSMFTHYFFEVFAIILAAECTNQDALNYYNTFCLQNFEKVFATNNSDLQPYAIQIMAVLIEQHPKGGLSQVYRNFLPFLFKENLLESSEFASAFFRILKSYLVVDLQFVLTSVKMQTLFEVALKPTKMCNLESFGFSLLISLIMACQNECIGLFEQSFKSMLGRFIATKILTFKRAFRHFIFNLIALFGGDFVLSLLGKTGKQDPVEFVARHLNVKFVTFNDDFERKTYFIGVAKLLFETPSLFVDTKYHNYWSSFFVETIYLLNPDQTLVHQRFLQSLRAKRVEDQNDYMRVAISVLSSVGSNAVDPFGDVDYKGLFDNQLKQFAMKNGSLISTWVNMCPLTKKDHVMGYLRDIHVF